MTNASRRSRILALIAAVLLNGRVVAQQPRTMAAADAAALANNRNEITIGRLTTSDRGELGCVPTLAIAFREPRPSGSYWAAAFTIVDPGGGDWVLAAEDPAGRTLWSVALRQTTAGQRVDTDLIADTAISISLRGPGTADAKCPRVTLDAELAIFPRSQPRGVFDVDDRWRINQSELRAEADSATILDWSNSIVKLVAVASDGALLPCTAFFISRHALMTASHCVSTDAELSRGKLFLNDGTEIPGQKLELVVVQGDLDFSVIWLPDPPMLQNLALASAQPAGRELVIWQFPVDLGRVVSVKGCTVREFTILSLEHRCDTAVGTSGAPIQSRGNGGVVALHTNGCTAATDSTTSCRNFGASMGLIVDRMRALAEALKAEQPAKAPELIAAFAAK